MTFQGFWNLWDAYNRRYNITLCSRQDHYLVLEGYKRSQMSQKELVLNLLKQVPEQDVKACFRTVQDALSNN